MLVARNYHSRRGEFDLVMTDRNCRVLIEVGERNNLDMGVLPTVSGRQRSGLSQ